MAKPFSNIADKIIEFIQVKIDQVKLNVVSSSSGIITGFLSVGLILLGCAFFLVFFSLGIAAILNKVLASSFWGYFIVGGIYLVIIIIIANMFRSGKLKNLLEKAFLDQLNPDDEEED